MNKSSQVVIEIVDHDLCCGCGVCAAVCPSANLQMVWQDNGDRAPQQLRDCPSGCCLCLRVCPFGPQSKSEDRLAQARFGSTVDIKHSEEVGFYLESFAGYSLSGGHRDRGASGGMATWLLETLLDKGKVDAVVCVSEGTQRDRLFEYKIMTEVEGLRRAAGSRYYPVDIAEALSLMNEGSQDVRYAVIGLPCVLKGLHLAMEIKPRLRRRIVYTLGLICGHLPNRFYTEYLAHLSGVGVDKLAAVQYRAKEKTVCAGNFKFQAISKDGSSGVDIPFLKISDIWGDGYFQVNACNYCDDIFSELADASFMDAWLPEYEHDPRGHSLIVVRHHALLPILHEGTSAGACCLQLLPISRITDSQPGVIENKRELLGARLFAARLRGEKVPDKRYPPDPKLYRKLRRKVEAHIFIQQASKAQWPRLRLKNSPMLRRHFFLLSLPLVWQRMVVRVRRVLKNPTLLLRLIGRA